MIFNFQSDKFISKKIELHNSIFQKKTGLDLSKFLFQENFQNSWKN